MHWNIPLNFSILTQALFLWVLKRFPPHLKRISTFFHPPQLGTHTYPLRTFSTPTPIGTPTFHFEHPPQVKQFLWCGILKQLFYSASLSFSTLNSILSSLTSQFLHLNCPKIKNTKRNYYQGITNYRVSNLTKAINLKSLKL